MANILDADVAINKLKDILGITYELAKRAYVNGIVTFTHLLTTDALTIDVTPSLTFKKGSSVQTIIQKGSGVAGTALTAGTGLTLYTVTSGKTLYLSFIDASVGSAAGMEIRDGGSSGTVVLSGSMQAGNLHATAILPTPMKFTTDVWLDLSASLTVRWGLVGWEEDT